VSGQDTPQTIEYGRQKESITQNATELVALAAAGAALEFAFRG
jgi:hypothetical protein